MGEKLNSSSPWEELVLNENGTRKDEYLKSEKGQEEVSIEDTFDQWVEELDDMVEKGEITREEALKQQEDMLNSAVQSINKVRSEEYERQRNEKIQALANIFAQVKDQKDAGVRFANLVGQVKGDETQDQAQEAETQDEFADINTLTKEEIQAEIAKLEQVVGEQAVNEDADIEKLTKEEIEAEIAKLENELHPLIVIDADVTHDKNELAEDLAEIDLNEEVANGKFLKRLWKGTLFKKYYHKKYTNEYLSGERTKNIDDEELTVYDLINRRKEGAIERFIMSVVEDEDAYVHKKAGESLKEADEETTAAIKTAIEYFALAPEDADEEDLERELENDLNRIKAEARDAKKGDYFVGNYLEVAKQARKCALQHIAMDRVMEGFKVYNAEVRDGVRTEAHRDNLDKIVNKLEGSAIGCFVPAEVLAGAVSIVSALTQTGARAIGGVAGGIAASGVMAGLRERNRITEDRARLLRDIANGKNYEDSSKYEAKIFGTHYDIRRAEDLAVDIEYAITAPEDTESRTDEILKAIAEARVRIDLSDEAKKDLIAYSSEDARGGERLNLDIMLIKAEKSLSEEDRARLEEMKAKILDKIQSDINEKDADFKRTRAKLALKKSGKTLAIGLGTFFASQEVIAAIDPNKIGIFEKAGLLKTENSKTASETLIASKFGFNRGSYTSAPEVVDKVQLNSDQEVEISRLGEGYTRTTVKDAWTEIPDTPNSVEEISPATLADRLRVKYDGWADNGTAAADGNELRLYLRDGQVVSGMRGASTMGNQTFDYEKLAAAGKIKGYVTVGGTKFELASKLNDAGQLTWGENGVFTTTAGETIKAVGDNGEKLYKYFEIAMDNGADENGIEHLIPFATDVGKDTFEGTLEKAVTIPIDHPAVYEFTKTITHEIPREVTGAGIALAPETAREGLGQRRRGRRIRHRRQPRRR